MNTKKKLRIIGVTLLFLWLIVALIGPAIVSGAKKSNMPPKYYQRNYIIAKNILGYSGTLLGAGLALLITGYALKEKETHNKE